MVTKKSTKSKCKKGEILRKGSLKKAHSRKTSTGKKVSIKQSRTPATCVKDVGAVGKGP